MDVHEQLRRARERKQLTLSALRKQTGIKEETLAAMEEGAFHLLPSGLYGRHAVRAYAKAVGLAPEEILASVAPHLPRGEDPLDGLARLKGVPRVERAPTVAASASSPPKIVDPFFARYALASMIDGAALAGVSLLVIALTAAACGLRPTEAAQLAAPALAVLLSLCSASYFVLLAGIRRSTFGETLAGVRVEPASHIVDARTAVRRGWTCALREASIVVEWLAGRGIVPGIMAPAEDGYRSL